LEKKFLDPSVEISISRIIKLSAKEPLLESGLIMVILWSSMKALKKDCGGW